VYREKRKRACSDRAGDKKTGRDFERGQIQLGESPCVSCISAKRGKGATKRSDGAKAGGENSPLEETCVRWKTENAKGLKHKKAGRGAVFSGWHRSQKI